MRGYTYSQLCDILEDNGWLFKHKKGSHCTYFKPGVKGIISIPDHKGDLCRPLAQRLLKDAGILI